jgi:TolB protein
MRRSGLSLVVGAVVLALAQPAHALDAGGVKGTQASSLPSLSADGRYLAFTTGSPLSAPDTGSIKDVYLRDLDTGLTLLASRANGPSGAAGNSASLTQRGGVLSDDGRYVTFESTATNLVPDDADSTQDIFVRDMQTGTTTLASRATGAAGAKANAHSTLAQISGNGRYVVFGSQATNLDPAATDTDGHVYLRDLQTDTTILIDRASGVNGAKAVTASQGSVSADGRYVAFDAIGGAGFTPDSDGNRHVYIRDTQTATTTLVSRASGVAGAKGTGASSFPSLSADGTHVAWGSTAPNLDPADTDTNPDAFVRNLQTNTTSLVRLATGAGTKSNGGSGARAISADGRYVAYGTNGTNLDPADTDGLFDLYIRDLQTGANTLASRATGASGAKANGTTDRAVLSGDGRLVAFDTAATNLDPDDTSTLEDVYVRDLQTLFTSLESRATPGHARPKGATPLRVALVPAYSPCVAPDRTHGPALAFPSCAAPAQTSAHLTVGTPDANGPAANSIGSVRLDALTGDFRIAASVTDVRCAAALPTCGAANTAGGPDYTGELRASFAVRQNDKFDSSGDAISTTLSDHALEFTFGCASTAASTGASCSVSTTANAVAPGMIRNGDRTSMGLGAVGVQDGGPDGDADTADNSLFATQGIFIP